MSTQEEIVKDEVTTEEATAETKETPNALLISVELAEAIGKYLMTKPMNEVEQLVSALRGSRAVTVTNNEESEE
jgi:hypothetical protein